MMAISGSPKPKNEWSFVVVDRALCWWGDRWVGDDEWPDAADDDGPNMNEEEDGDGDKGDGRDGKTSDDGGTNEEANPVEVEDAMAVAAPMVNTIDFMVWGNAHGILW